MSARNVGSRMSYLQMFTCLPALQDEAAPHRHEAQREVLSGLRCRCPRYSGGPDAQRMFRQSRYLCCVIRKKCAQCLPHPQHHLRSVPLNEARTYVIVELGKIGHWAPHAPAPRAPWSGLAYTLNRSGCGGCGGATREPLGLSPEEN